MHDQSHKDAVYAAPAAEAVAEAAALREAASAAWAFLFESDARTEHDLGDRLEEALFRLEERFPAWRQRG